MEYFDKEFCLEVWGAYACFTRPELKVERVSYDVMTPSAARAIFESIFWKPAIHWQVTKIEVLNPIKWCNIRRNEVGAVASKNPVYIEEKRQQKNSLLLQDVRYRKICQRQPRNAPCLRDYDAFCAAGNCQYRRCLHAVSKYRSGASLYQQRRNSALDKSP